LLKKKSEALSIFQQFKALVENLFSRKIKAVQSDWGGELRPFTQFLSQHGILHRLICPHTHHQNGMVERKHRQIVDMGGTHIISSGFITFAILGLCFYHSGVSYQQVTYVCNSVCSTIH